MTAGPKGKPIRFTRHARIQCRERGATEEEVALAVSEGLREPVKRGRILCRYNFPYAGSWQGATYAVKQVAPVIAEQGEEIVVITVYTFYF
jgi:hypothetical protein